MKWLIMFQIVCIWNVKCSYGWIECECLADRSAYDLCNQPEHSGSEITAREVFTEPGRVKRLICVPDEWKLSNTFRKNAQTQISKRLTLKPYENSKSTLGALSIILGKLQTYSKSFTQKFKKTVAVLLRVVCVKRCTDHSETFWIHNPSMLELILLHFRTQFLDKPRPEIFL